MPATIIRDAASAIAAPSASSHSCSDTSRMLHQRMLDAGYSPDDIGRVESALLSVRLHDTYLRDGYSPDDIAAVTSLY